MTDTLSLLPTICPYVILATGVLVLIGGVIGFLKAQSMPSLIAGVLSGILTISAFGVTYLNMIAGVIMAFVIFVCLTIVFAIRVKKTRKFMPAGMMLIIVSLSETFTLLTLLKLFEVF